MALTTGTPINDAEFPRTATTAAVPGVSILQINFAGNDVFYGRLVEINFTNTAKTQGNLVFTAPALSVAAAGQYNYQDTLDLYIGGVWIKTWRKKLDKGAKTWGRNGEQLGKTGAVLGFRLPRS